LLEQLGHLEPDLRRADQVVVDASGIGLGFYEAARGAIGPRVLGATITGAQGQPSFPDRYGVMTVGKAWLVGRVARALRERAFSVGDYCPGRDALRDELRQMEISRSRTGRLRLEARVGHDDLVLALALAFLARDVHGSREHERDDQRDRHDAA
jgi:hypothetical protein